MTSLAFIWDMDGTLVDSYPAIVPTARELLAEHGIILDEAELHRELIRTSVGAVLERIASERGFDAAALKAEFNRRNDRRIAAIRPMPHCAQTLAALRDAGHRSFVYTHRGASCAAILEQTGLSPYFTEVVTALSGFPRKPEPDGILYLMEKYEIDPARCYYVGDRSLDVEAARRAGIGSILLLDPDSPGEPTGSESFLIRDLQELPALAERLTMPSP